MSTHTPGPWDVCDDAVLADDGCVEVAAVPLHDGMNPTEWQANLCLIAAAPDLLAAAKHALANPGCGDDDCCDAARAQASARLELREAIAKAEGTR